jgi:hypothetical protein
MTVDVVILVMAICVASAGTSVGRSGDEGGSAKRNTHSNYELLHNQTP